MENAFYNPLPHFNEIPRWRRGERIRFSIPLTEIFTASFHRLPLAKDENRFLYFGATKRALWKDEERINCLIPFIITQFPNKKFKINPNITEDQHKD